MDRGRVASIASRVVLRLACRRFTVVVRLNAIDAPLEIFTLLCCEFPVRGSITRRSVGQSRCNLWKW